MSGFEILAIIHLVVAGGSGLSVIVANTLTDGRLLREAGIIGHWKRRATYALSIWMLVALSLFVGAAAW